MKGQSRGKWDGMLTILRFNWPLYAAALAMLLAGTAGLIFADFHIHAAASSGRSSPAASGNAAAAAIAIRAAVGLAVLGSAYFLIGSLAVSHWVYDRSDLYRWTWLDRILKNAPAGIGHMLLGHTGFDEASPVLRRRFPQSRWRVLDHFDPATMTEASIRRARKLFPPPPDTEAVCFDRWPVESGGTDVILGLLAIHELRGHAERAAWFAEARRCLAPGGLVILAEHVRDTANLLAFGPGFLHFHSVSAWRKSWQAADLTLTETFRITPFVRIFVLRKK